jgi:hypothetical protein
MHVMITEVCRITENMSGKYVLYELECAFNSCSVGSYEPNSEHLKRDRVKDPSFIKAQ